MNKNNGLCECGVCGQTAPLAKNNHTKNNYIKGQPVHFIQGHQNRKHGVRSQLFKDLTGQVFGRLTVVELAWISQDSRRESVYHCVCKCGSSITVRGNDLRSGNSTSCGCIRKEQTTAMGLANTVHGHTSRAIRTTLVSPTYTSWLSMLNRAGNRRGDHPSYAHISVCPEWLTFEGFLESVGERPKGTTLGRILDRGNYEPGNCFWMTKEEQNISRRNNHALAKWAA